MNPVALYLAIAPITGLAADVTLSFSDISQALVRPAYRPTTDPAAANQSNGTAVDLSTTPSGTLLFDWKHSDLRFGYAPTFTLRDVFGPSDDSQSREPLLMHTGLVSFSHSPEGARWRLTLTQVGNIGKQNFSALAPLVPADPSARPDPSMSRLNLIPSARQQAVKVAAEQTSVSLAHQWSRQWSTNVIASYGTSGGYDGDQAVLPRQTTESGSVAVRFATGRRDAFTTAVSASHTLVTTGYEYLFGQATETWTHELGKDLSLALTGGLAEVWTRCRIPSTCQLQNAQYADGRYQATLRPIASASLIGALFLLKQRDLVISLLLGSGVSPVINPLTGELETRVQGSATLQALIASRTTLAATLDAAQSIPENTARVIGIGVLGSHRLGRAVAVSAGYRTFWQYTSDPRYDLPRQWIGFVGLTLNAPPIRL